MSDSTQEALCQLKKPATAFFLWLNATREQIRTDIGSKTFGDVARKASEMWKAMSTTEKEPWEAKAKEQKDAYEKFKATDAGQKALEEKKAARAEGKQAKDVKNAKKAAKSVEKDEKLKKPASAYFLYSNEKREEVQQLLGTKDMGPVAKKTTEMWKSLTDEGKKPWDDKAKQQKEVYEAYIKTEEGAAALQAYKDEVKEAKASVSGKNAVEADSPDKTPAKRAKRATDSPKEAKPERAAKKARSVKEAPKDLLSEEVIAACKKEQKAGEPSVEAMLRKLLETEKLVEKGLTAEQGLDALKESGGLLNKARGMLVAQLGA